MANGLELRAREHRTELDFAHEMPNKVIYTHRFKYDLNGSVKRFMKKRRCQTTLYPFISNLKTGACHPCFVSFGKSGTVRNKSPDKISPHLSLFVSHFAVVLF